MGSRKKFEAVADRRLVEKQSDEQRSGAGLFGMQ
jgi:hypothetical protein